MGTLCWNSFTVPLEQIRLLPLFIPNVEFKMFVAMLAVHCDQNNSSPVPREKGESQNIPLKRLQNIFI